MADQLLVNNLLIRISVLKRDTQSTQGNQIVSEDLSTSLRLALQSYFSYHLTLQYPTSYTTVETFIP